MRAINLKYHALAFITIAFWGVVCNAPLFTALFTFGASRIFKGDMKDGLEDVKFGKPAQERASKYALI